MSFVRSVLRRVSVTMPAMKSGAASHCVARVNAVALNPPRERRGMILFDLNVRGIQQVQSRNAGVRPAAVAIRWSSAGRDSTTTNHLARRPAI
jgi:hypothetical protein